MTSGHIEPHFDADGWCMCGRACCVETKNLGIENGGTCICEDCPDKAFPLQFRPKFPGTVA